jgi:hypothetical protein
MGTKSIREIVESACVTHLGDQGLSSYQIEPGLSVDSLNPPFVVASAEAIAPMADIAQVLGNFAVTVQVMVMTPTDDTSSLANHRAAVEKVMSAFADVAGFKTVFTAAGDATLYDVTFQAIDDGRGDRTFGTTVTYLVECVLAP